jgi:nucleoid DNA-binding protein
MSGLVEVAKEAGLKPEVVANVFETILSMAANGDSVRIKGFGTFERRNYPGRTLVTPAVNNGEPITYPDSYVLKFHQSGLAKRRINIVAKKAKRAEQAAAEPAKKVTKAKKSVPPPAAKKKKTKARPADDEE